MLFPGEANLHFAEPQIVHDAEVAVMSLAKADLDGDGSMDLVLGTSAANLALVNDGAGQFTAVPLPGIDAVTYGVAIGDMTGDGRADIVFANSAAPNLVLPVGD
jgi:hypothetical protein